VRRTRQEVKAPAIPPTAAPQIWLPKELDLLQNSETKSHAIAQETSDKEKAA